MADESGAAAAFSLSVFSLAAPVAKRPLLLYQVSRPLFARRDVAAVISLFLASCFVRVSPFRLRRNSRFRLSAFGVLNSRRPTSSRSVFALREAFSHYLRINDSKFSGNSRPPRRVLNRSIYGIEAAFQTAAAESCSLLVPHFLSRNQTVAVVFVVGTKTTT